MKSPIIFIDFDGTITIEDLAFQILGEFADRDWIEIDKKFENGEISLIECMTLQYSMIRGNYEDFENFINLSVMFRDGFKDFVDYTQIHQYQAMILSAGLDFAISHCIKLLKTNIPVIAVKTQLIDGYIKVDGNSVPTMDGYDFKASTIRDYKNKNFDTIMIGDGSTDYQAAAVADLTFAVKNSKLHKYCMENKFNHKSFENFHQIIQHLRSINSS